ALRRYIPVYRRLLPRRRRGVRAPSLESQSVLAGLKTIDSMRSAACTTRIANRYKFSWRPHASHGDPIYQGYKHLPTGATCLPSYLIAALTVAFALFMENLDSTVISTSLPAIASDLNEDPIALKLALTSYLFSLAIFIPASGWAADRFGARTTFRAAILVFV